LVPKEEALERNDVRRLQALLALHDLELDLLTLGQRLVAVGLDRTEVDEDVLALSALDESVALLVRKPLDGALCQTILLHYKTNDGPGTSRRPRVKRPER
jgi:hypothetical protein